MNKTYSGLLACDGFALGSQRTITPEGFLEAPATIARTGVQLYRARELGLDKHGVAGDTIVRLHRPTEELFNPETLASFNGKPVIIEPHRTVNADNWREMAVGDVHDVFVDGPNLSARKFILRDKKGIDTVLGGKRHLSIGYTFDLDMTPGTTADGQQYDGVQRNIRGNHVVITSSPRGGSGMTIADSASVQQQERKMKKVIVNNVPVEVGDSEAGIIESLIAERDAARNQQPTVVVAGKTITGSDAILAEITGRDTEIANLRAAQLSEAQIEEKVNVRVLVVGDASRLVKEFDAKGKSNHQVRQEVLTAVTGEDAVAKSIAVAVLAGKEIGDASEEALTAAFAAVVAHKTAMVKDVNGADAALAAALTKSRETVKTGGDTDSKPTGRDGFHARSADAWRS